MTTTADVIVACATPLAAAGIAIIRVSGEGALELLRPCLPAKTEIVPRVVTVTTFNDPLTQTNLDQVCCLYFKVLHGIHLTPIKNFDHFSLVITYFDMKVRVASTTFGPAIKIWCREKTNCFQTKPFWLLGIFVMKF